MAIALLKMISEKHSFERLQLEILKTNATISTYIKIKNESVVFADKWCANREQVQMLHGQCASAHYKLKQHLQIVKISKNVHQLQDVGRKLRKLRLNLECLLTDLVFLVGKTYCQVCISLPEPEVPEAKTEAMEAKTEALKTEAMEVKTETLAAKNELIQELRDAKAELIVTKNESLEEKNELIKELRENRMHSRDFRTTKGFRRLRTR